MGDNINLNSKYYEYIDPYFNVGDTIFVHRNKSKSGCHAIFTCVGKSGNRIYRYKNLSENSKLRRIEYWYYTRYYAIKYSIINGFRRFYE